MKEATLTVTNHGKEVAELIVDEIPDDQTEAALIKHYNQHIKLFMRHLGYAAHVSKLTWGARS